MRQASWAAASQSAPGRAGSSRKDARDSSSTQKACSLSVAPTGRKRPSRSDAASRTVPLWAKTQWRPQSSRMKACWRGARARGSSLRMCATAWSVLIGVRAEEVREASGRTPRVEEEPRRPPLEEGQAPAVAVRPRRAAALGEARKGKHQVGRRPAVHPEQFAHEKFWARSYAETLAAQPRATERGKLRGLPGRGMFVTCESRAGCCPRR